jgi:Family of unknown function (DUF6526)
MSDDAVQSFSNHARWLGPWHFFALPVLVANAVVQIGAAARHPGLDSVWAAAVATALATAVYLARRMPVRLQDRVIRLEETLRLERLMPDRALDIERLTLGQLIGIRFASDAEVPHLLDRILSGELVSRDDVKRSVQHWRSDHTRV